MPENYIQILLLLTANPGGLTTENILKECEKSKYKGINDIKKNSNLVYNMRNAGLISTSDAVGGKIHRITTKGEEELRKETADEIKDTQTEKVASQVVTLQPESLPHLPVSIDEKNMLSEFDEAVKTMRQSIMMAMEGAVDAIKITDKTRKIATLESLAAMPIFTQDLADMLNAIRSDLEQLEES